MSKSPQKRTRKSRKRKVRQPENRAYRLIVAGAGPAGLAAALGAVGAGEDPAGILVVEQREDHNKFDPRSHRSRQRVVVLDTDAVGGLSKLGATAPGSTVNEMVVHLPSGGRRYFPNFGSWQIGVSAIGGGRTLSRMASLASIESSLYEAYRKAGGRVAFGMQAALRVSPNGRGMITTNGSDYTADLIVVAEGARSRTLRNAVRQIPVASSSASHFLCFDIPAFTSNTLRPGDLASAFDVDSRTLAYGFICDEAASLNMLLPQRCGTTEEARDFLPTLQNYSASFGLKGSPIIPEGAAYSGAITMANRSLVGRNVVLIGDVLRNPDAISGAGVNAALRDGFSVGDFCGRSTRSSEGRSLQLLLDELSSHTRFAVELSLYVRELAGFLIENPMLASNAFRVGRSARLGQGSLLDAAKNTAAAWVQMALGTSGQSRAIQEGLKAMGGLPTIFDSPARNLIIGDVHPDTTIPETS